MESVELSDLSEELYRDVPIPAELDGLPDTSDTVFFGRNTGSCCHIHAHEEAVVFQLMGTKVFSLYHPDDVRQPLLRADHQRLPPQPGRFPGHRLSAVPARPRAKRIE